MISPERPLRASQREPDDPAVLDQTRFTENISPEQRDDWAEMWVDVKAS